MFSLIINVKQGIGTDAGLNWAPFLVGRGGGGGVDGGGVRTYAGA